MALQKGYPMDTLEQFLAHALRLEQDAAERFDELADALMVHHAAPEVVDLFRRMAHFSRLHHAEATARAEGRDIPSYKSWEYEWPNQESPENALWDDTHYKMTPWHALHTALASERAGYDFYKNLRDTHPNPQIRALAAEFTEEEAEHVAELEKWLEDTPPPPADWHEDMDPPGSGE
jgi:rubrerythrin